jgi:Protein of unknown function (DUF2905)
VRSGEVAPRTEGTPGSEGLARKARLGRPGSGGTMGKTLVLVGLGIAILGVLVLLGVPLGRLPGDFQVRRGNFSFYFPLASSIVLSILLTLLMALFRR